MIVSQVIFWTGLSLIGYTYLIFPAIIHLMALVGQHRREKEPDPTFPGTKPGHPGQKELSQGEDEFPMLSILIAAYNEAGVIEAKINSVLESEYPPDRVEILVGSDASSDSTSEIIQRMGKQHDRLEAVIFEKRTGKPGIINQLVSRSRGEILVITDANVMLDKHTLLELARSFSRPLTGLVDTRMVNPQMKKDGISRQERFYIGREVKIKHHESVVWGTMMGPFGGCYAVRKTAYEPVPDHFLVDDFFVNMAVLKKGLQCVSNVNAVVYEEVSNNLWEEFRRKQRISAGNFQNLSRFSSMLFSRRPGVSFCFLSHKVIRWIVPFLVFFTLGSSIVLATGSTFYLWMALLQGAVLLVPVLDHFLRKIKIHSLPLRFISHFVLMNLALLAGFFRYIKGITSNVWQPTRRNQD
jgi:cellulose synthase/poly-beta-1,6-N-acetylglucosamine synthase-like glycosyltransferase